MSGPPDELGGLAVPSVVGPHPAFLTNVRFWRKADIGACWYVCWYRGAGNSINL
jgi:hypothetical protein